MPYDICNWISNLFMKIKPLNNFSLAKPDEIHSGILKNLAKTSSDFWGS